MSRERIATTRRDPRNIKQRFVETTYRMIEKDGFENISIRKIAQRVGCDSAVLYRHFKSLDYLIILGSIGFLEEYVHGLIDVERAPEKNIDRAIDSWHVFSSCAFQNPPLYRHVFFDCDSQMFEEAIVEYYQLFPLKLQDEKNPFYGFFFMSLFNGNPHERNFYYFNRAANENSIASKDVDYLCCVCPFIFEGMLKTHAGDYKDPAIAKAAQDKCDNLIDRVIESCRIDEHEARITPCAE